ncbi:MAG: sugar phosphate isomerase/epimerase [Spirochaetes bacterium]|nr:sugar phosphate isomerase/epimerase [Spirochaetota bacterium]
MRKPDVPGFFSWFGYSLPIEDRLRLISEAGFDRVSIWLGDEEACVSEHRPADLCAAAAWNGLCVECAHAPYDDCNLLWSDEDSAANPLIGRMVSWIRFCGTQGIPVMVMHLTRGDDPPHPSAAGFSRIEDLVEEASRSSVVVALENTRKTAAVDLALSAIDSPHLGFCYDSSHDFLYASHPTDILHRWGERLATTHLSDNDGTRDRHWIPGRGTIDWARIREALPKQRPLPLSLEVVPIDPGSQSSESFLCESMERGMALVRMLTGEKA